MGQLESVVLSIRGLHIGGNHISPSLSLLSRHQYLRLSHSFCLYFCIICHWATLFTVSSFPLYEFLFFLFSSIHIFSSNDISWNLSWGGGGLCIFQYIYIHSCSINRAEFSAVFCAVNGQLFGPKPHTNQGASTNLLDRKETFRKMF